MDDSLLEQQRAAYAVQGVDESEPVQAANKKKRKKDEYTNGDEVGHTLSYLNSPTSGPVYSMVNILGEVYPGKLPGRFDG